MTGEIKKRGPKGARGRPVNPNRVRKIVHWRDVKNLTYREIAEKLEAADGYSQTEQAVYTAYTRWRDWAYANPV